MNGVPTSWREDLIAELELAGFDLNNGRGGRPPADWRETFSDFDLVNAIDDRADDLPELDEMVAAMTRLARARDTYLCRFPDDVAQRGDTDEGRSWCEAVERVCSLVRRIDRLTGAAS
jgi:hypothetical protein